MNDLTRLELALWISEPRLCCIVDTDGYLFGKAFCNRCFRRLRAAVVEILIEWDLITIEKVIQWKYD